LTVEKTFETAKLLQQLFAALLPDVEVPVYAQFLRWAGRFGNEAVTHAINRTAAKRAKDKWMDRSDCERYLTSVASKVAKEQTRTLCPPAESRP
jgi:hypothetical protein